MLSWAVDVGNSRIKLGLFAGRSLLKNYAFSLSDFADSESFWELLPERAMVSTVLSDEKTAGLFKRFENCDIAFSYLGYNTPLPISSLYKSQETLGKDRISAVAGAQLLFPQQDLLVVDLGTCITFDFLNKDGQYQGGAISPGIRMRLQAMNKFTSKLPLGDWKMEDHVELIGSSTENSLLSGAVNGSVAEVDGVISNYLALFPALKVILTGGDASFFEKNLKNTIFADPNLVLKGLNEILLYNSENT